MFIRVCTMEISNFLRSFSHIGIFNRACPQNRMNIFFKRISSRICLLGHVGLNIAQVTLSPSKRLRIWLQQSRRPKKSDQAYRKSLSSVPTFMSNYIICTVHCTDRSLSYILSNGLAELDVNEKRNLS